MTEHTAQPELIEGPAADTLAKTPGTVGARRAGPGSTGGAKRRTQAALIAEYTDNGRKIVHGLARMAGFLPDEPSPGTAKNKLDAMLSLRDGYWGRPVSALAPELADDVEGKLGAMSEEDFALLLEIRKDFTPEEMRDLAALRREQRERAAAHGDTAGAP